MLQESQDGGDSASGKWRDNHEVTPGGKIPPKHVSSQLSIQPRSNK